MGSADQAASIPADVSNNGLPAALLAFPSPASTTASLDSPTLSRSLTGSLPGAAWSPRSIAEASSAVPTVPGDVNIMPLATPNETNTLQPDLNMIVGGALAPVQTTIPDTAAQKTGPGLRLPSFESLGIASPHPDRIAQQGSESSLATATREAMTESLSVSQTGIEPLHARDHDLGSPAWKSGGRAVLGSVQQRVATLTPPAEGQEIDWHPTATTIPTNHVETPSTDPGLPTRSSSIAQAGPGAETGDSNVPTPIVVVGHQIGDESRGWLDGAVQTLLGNLSTAQLPSNPLRVLSHALPSPSATGHAFPTIIDAIHASTPTSPTVWINVFHAIPGRFNLADLPTSPPSTPGPPIGGDDYFTQKVFDSAVPVTDYQEDLSSLPRSPRPIVPPSSINVSVVERYIPPTSPNEFADMFNYNGPSILVDRLVELSPHNGSLTFIYPTKTGSQTFMREYLGPILDPLLRSMCVVHGLSSDLSRMVGNMAACDRLLEHEQLEQQILRLCAILTQRSTGMQRFHGRRANFSLAYAAKKEVPLSREVWAKDWWTKQEKPRVRDVVTRFAHEAQKKSSNEHVERPATPAELIHHLLDGVARKPYQPGTEPDRGIEVSVFVIKRSE